jgi:iron complex transport system ATP-binding protein
VGSVVDMTDVSVRRGSALLLDSVSWQVSDAERWVILGPNGAGKTTLLLIASGRLFPTRGDVALLDESMGAVNLAELRPRIGFATGAHIADFPPAETVADVVMSGAHGVTGRWREEYDDVDASRAERLMSDWGIAELADRTIATLSEGERKRTLIARSLMADPELLLLDEPAAGLDLGGREDLVARLEALAAAPDSPVIVLVTHHLEEVPPGFTHALLLRAGRVTAQGPLAQVLTPAGLTAAFDQPIEVEHAHGRWTARRGRFA